MGFECGGWKARGAGKKKQLTRGKKQGVGANQRRGPKRGFRVACKSLSRWPRAKAESETLRFKKLIPGRDICDIKKGASGKEKVRKKKSPN